MRYKRGVGSGASWMLQDVVCRELEIMGEAASQLSEGYRQGHPEVPWRQMIGTRNRLIHAYANVDPGIVWDIACSDIPSVLRRLRELLGD